MAPVSKNHGTVKTGSLFNAEADCQVLRAAMKGLGTDEKAIIDVLARRDAFQRAEIKLKFKTLYGKDLGEELQSELSGHFNQLCQGLLLDLVHYEAKELRSAMKGAGTNEHLLIEIICSRSNVHLIALKEVYAQMFNGHTLEQDIESDTSGHFKCLLISLLQAQRDVSQTVDPHKAQADALRLYEAGEKMLGTDESVFNEILVSRSDAHLSAVFYEYKKLSKKSIEHVISSEMSGDMCKGMLTLVRCVQNKPAYFAQALYDSMVGVGTRDDDLVRIVLTRCEVDMELIKQEFERLHQKTLATLIKDETSGDYKTMLLALIGEQ